MICEVCSVFYCSADANFYHCCLCVWEIVLMVCLILENVIVRMCFRTFGPLRLVPQGHQWTMKAVYFFLYSCYLYAVKQKTTRHFTDVQQQPQTGQRMEGQTTDITPAALSFFSIASETVKQIYGTFTDCVAQSCFFFFFFFQVIGLNIKLKQEYEEIQIWCHTLWADKSRHLCDESSGRDVKLKVESELGLCGYKIQSVQILESWYYKMI